METKNFIIIGAAGYVAVKHLKAIKAVGGKVVAAIDPNDNLEILDEYFPECEYFKSTEKAQEFVTSNTIDFVTICSPSYLHGQHIQFALENECDVVCESPLVLSEKEYEEIKQLEKKSNKKVVNFLQYRNSADFQDLKDNIAREDNVFIDFKNYSYRGKWFKQSWKGDLDKSGGLLTVLGYHFFDAFIWIYGKPVGLQLDKVSPTKITGVLTLEKANVNFELNNQQVEGKNSRQLEIVINGKEILLDEPDEVLFEKSYHDIINKKGFGIEEVAETVRLVSKAG